MTKIGPIEIKNAFLCDDVRQEVNNKHTLVGVYSGNIVLPRVPADVLLGLFMEMETPAGAHEIEIRISGPGKGSATLKANIQQAESGSASLANSRAQFHMEKEGVFRVDARTPGGRWANVIKKRVLVRAPATASEPPSEQSQPASPASSKPRARPRRASQVRRRKK